MLHKKSKGTSLSGLFPYFSGDTESKRVVMIKTFESEWGKEYTSSRGLKKNNGERDMGKIDEVRLGLETAYIDGSVVSNNIYRPEFVSNNHKAGKKVFSSIEDELLACDSL